MPMAESSMSMSMIGAPSASASATITPTVSNIPCSIWKLYHNPHYSLPSSSSTCSSSSSSSCTTQHKHHGHSSYCFSTVSSRSRSANSRSFRSNNALADIKDLRSELEVERRMRRKLEAANKTLVKDKEAAEERCRRLVEEVAEVRREMEKVQMELAEAKATVVMKDKINTNVSNSNSSEGSTMMKKEVENPHIKRGIKGMEFPRGVGVRVKGMNGMGSSSSPKERRGGGGGGQLGSNNLECQRAQLRVLMRQKTPPTSAHNLVM